MKAIDDITSLSPGRMAFSGFGKPQVDLEKIYSENSDDTFGEKQIRDFNSKLEVTKPKMNATAQNGFWGDEHPQDYVE